MDPITAIGLAIAIIKGGIAIYQLIHDHPQTTQAVRDHLKGLMNVSQSQLDVAQGMYDQLQAQARANYQGA